MDITIPMILAITVFMAPMLILLWAGGRASSASSVLSEQDLLAWAGLSDSVRREFLEQIPQGQRIKLIKRVRELTGLELVRSTALIDRLEISDPLEMLTREEVELRLGIPQGELADLVLSGELKGYQRGERMLFKVADVRTFEPAETQEQSRLRN